MIRLMLLSAISLLLFLSCSTLFNSSSQEIHLKTEKGYENVKVEIIGPNGSYTTRIPTKISAVSAYKGVTIKINDKCYDKASFIVNKSVTHSFWANILLWPCFAVDLITGKYWKYEKEKTIPLNIKDDCNTVNTGEN